MELAALAAMGDVVLSPGGGMAVLILYLLWRVRRLSDVCATQFDRVLELTARAERAEALVEARRQVREG